MSMLIYLLKVSLALLFCWALYWTAFKRLTFFQWNRIYLLASVVLSIFLPLLRLQWGNTVVAVADFGGIDWTYVDHLAGSPEALKESSSTWSPASLVLIVYLSVAMSLLGRSALRFRQLGLSTRGARIIRKGRVQVYLQDQRRGSFTLFRRIYLDRHAFERRLDPVLKHEMVHARQLHSLDLLFMEFVVAMLWFNPFVFVLLRAIRENHEYLADRGAHSDQDSLRDYLECLRAETIRYFSPVPASYFKSSTIKKRIIMLTHNKSNQRKKWRYLGILPLMAFMLILFHSPAEQGKAGTAMGPNGLLSNAESLFIVNGIPSMFPLPEQYKEKITWGYNQKALHPITSEETTHLGIDVAAPTGTPVYAAADGVVQKAVNEKGWGKLVIVEHEDGHVTFYAHMNEIEVDIGAKVHKGEVIGSVGNTGQSTGPHLHYEVRLNGEHQNPKDFF
jgi:hypothetical protein